MPARYGVVSPKQTDHAVRVGSETLAFRGCVSYTNSRDMAQEAAERVDSGIVVEREAGTLSQRGIVFIQLGRCRGCEELPRCGLHRKEH